MTRASAPDSPPQVALIGFGEAGETFARAGGWHGHSRRLGYQAGTPRADGRIRGGQPPMMRQARWPMRDGAFRWSPPIRR